MPFAKPSCLQRIRSAILALGLFAAASGPAPAIDNSTIKIIVPAPPGGAGDIVARILVEQIRRTQNQSIIVESRPGAGTMIATESVIRSSPDGNTLLLNAPFLLIGPQLRNLNFNPMSELEPICHLVGSPGVIVVNETSPYRTFDELMGAARSRPGELSFASAGPGTTHQIGFEKLKQETGASFIYVPFPGGASAINALLGNHVTAVLAEYAPLSEHLKSGRLRALAVTSKTRVPSLASVPAVAESHKDFEVDFWWGLFAPAKTPQAKVSLLADWLTSALEHPELKERLIALGFLPAGICGPEFAGMLRKQFEDYGKVIREAKIRAD